MNKESLIANLIEEDDIELIYSTTKFSENSTKIFINYTIICRNEPVTTDINLCKKIIATMEVIKTLLKNFNVTFSYTIKSADELDRELIKNYDKTVKTLLEAEIIHSKDAYINKIIAENRGKGRA